MATPQIVPLMVVYFYISKQTLKRHCICGHLLCRKMDGRVRLLLRSTDVGPNVNCLTDEATGNQLKVILDPWSRSEPEV